MFKIKDIQFCARIWKWKKKNKKFLTFQSGDLNPRFLVIFPPMIWSEGPEIKLKQASKRDRALKEIFTQMRFKSIGPNISSFYHKFCINWQNIAGFKTDWLIMVHLIKSNKREQFLLRLKVERTLIIYFQPFAWIFF